MASITIRDLPDQTKEALRVSAARSGISLEAYVRLLLQRASSSDLFSPVNVSDLAEECFGPRKGVDLELPSRGSKRQSVDFR